ncbi:hypothetical protein H0H81_000479, partial [Sphagnurus paluster]
MASQYWPQNQAIGTPDPFSTSVPAGPVDTTHHAQAFATPVHPAAAPTAPDNFSQAGTPASAFGEMELPNDDASTPTKRLPLHGDTYDQLPAPESNWSQVPASRGWAHFDQLIQGNNTWNVHDYSHHLLRMGLHLDYLTNGLQVQGNENNNTNSPAFEIVADNISTSKLTTLMDWLEVTAEYFWHIVEHRADYQPEPLPINIDDDNEDNHDHETNMQEVQEQDDEY